MVDFELLAECKDEGVDCCRRFIAGALGITLQDVDRIEDMLRPRMKTKEEAAVDDDTFLRRALAMVDLEKLHEIGVRPGNLSEVQFAEGLLHLRAIWDQAERIRLGVIHPWNALPTTISLGLPKRNLADIILRVTLAYNALSDSAIANNPALHDIWPALADKHETCLRSPGLRSPGLVSGSNAISPTVSLPNGPGW